MKMRCISIRQPWAYFIVQGFKPVENRTWRTNFRGPVLIHAARGMTQGEWEAATLFAHKQCGVPRSALRDYNELERGGIVGYAEITDCVTESKSPWFVGPVGFTLANAAPLPFFACKGALSFFTVDVPDNYLAGIHNLKAAA